MSKQNNHIFNIYKTLRNYIRKYYLLDGLYVIWGYARNNIFNLPFPNDIEKPNSFDPNGDLFNKRYFGLPEFEQEFLVKQFIIHCNLTPTSNSILKKDNLKVIINYLRHTLSEEVDKINENSSDFLLEFHRMAHRQFIWQPGYSQNGMLRYYKLYSYAPVSKIVEQTFGIKVYDLFILAFYCFAITGKQFKTQLPFKSDIPQLSSSTIDTFLSEFSIKLEDFRNELINLQQMNENIFLYIQSIVK
ncbi:MAG: hypothetical protein IPL74_15115 [Bacteroidetes bacterium]|nr:hypothetical protein [Bacteroidota bacterium]